MRWALLLVALWSVTTWASDLDPTHEIARRSGLPASEVTALLNDCDADQTSMNFCAWRDQIVAEQALQRAVEEKYAASPKCKLVSGKDIARWKDARDKACRESAQKEWGDGSMKPAAQAMCATASTKRMIDRIKASKCAR